GALMDVVSLRVVYINRLKSVVICWAALKLRLGRCLVVDLPDLLGALNRRVERDIRIAVLRRPDDRLGADNAGDPDARIRLLQRHRPRVDDAVPVVRALPAERSLARPCRNDEIVRLFKALAVEGGVDAG